MTRFILITFTIISLLTGSCSGRKNKLDTSNMIPEDELVSVLTDIYIADGLVTVPRIHSFYSNLDSITSYYKVIENHGYTKETMDKTMKFYFIKNPKKLIRIYDRVLGILTEMETRVNNESLSSGNKVNSLWKGKEFFHFPGTLEADSALLAMNVNKKGILTIKFSATLFPDDQTLNPRITFFSCHPDSIETGKRNYIETLNYIKDGQPHTYSVSITTSDVNTLHLRCFFYTFDNNPSEKHAAFEDIILTYAKR